jgi:hypothetical protein
MAIVKKRRQEYERRVLDGSSMTSDDAVEAE